MGLRQVIGNAGICKGDGELEEDEREAMIEAKCDAFLQLS